MMLLVVAALNVVLCAWLHRKVAGEAELTRWTNDLSSL